MIFFVLFSHFNFSKRIRLEMIPDYAIHIPALRAGTPMTTKCLERGGLGCLFLPSKLIRTPPLNIFEKYLGVGGAEPHDNNAATASVFLCRQI
jgi:hypothetical protein